MMMKNNQAIAVNIPNEIHLKITHQQFIELALANRDLQLERSATGELIIMLPTGSDTGRRDLLSHLATCSGRHETGSRQAT